MSVQAILDKMRNIQSVLIEYLDEEGHQSNDFDKIINDLKTGSNPNELKSFLHLILSISKNHHRANGFFDSITKILIQLKDQIKKHFTNYQIFNIFKRNKRIILSLVENGMIEFDHNIISYLSDLQKLIKRNSYEVIYVNDLKYVDDYFYFQKEINKEAELPENFEENRKKGENHYRICELIRNDMIDEFITYINQNNISFGSKIKQSKYETKLIFNQ